VSVGTEYKMLEVHDRLTSQKSKPSVNDVSCMNFIKYICVRVYKCGPPLWSSGQSLWLHIQRSRVRSPVLPDFLSSSGSGTGSTQPREVN
jgi:hypothetical protein